MIPFESGGLGSAAQHNYMLYTDIKEKAVQASLVLGSERGEPSDVRGSGMRNSHLLAVAPNASSSSIVGTSPSVEPFAANAYNAQGRAGSFLIKNKYLEQYLESVGKNTKEVWNIIIADDGSVRNVQGIPDEVKKVFATAREINPMWTIEHASTRAPIVCQAVSNNINVPKDITKQEMSDIHMKAWKGGVKTLYYCRGEAAVKASVTTTQPLNAVSRETIEYTECLACEG
jgi:ribonucleoside-diphosphate reductase alpha chain